MSNYTRKRKESTPNREDSDEFDLNGFINPKHILVMYKLGWFDDKESALAQYICCSVKMREYNNRKHGKSETYHESEEKIAAKFGMNPATVRTIIHRTKLFHREGGTGERRRVWRIGESPIGKKAKPRPFPAVKGSESEPQVNLPENRLQG